MIFFCINRNFSLFFIFTFKFVDSFNGFVCIYFLANANENQAFDPNEENGDEVAVVGHEPIAQAAIGFQAIDVQDEQQVDGTFLSEESEAFSFVHFYQF